MLFMRLPHKTNTELPPRDSEEQERSPLPFDRPCYTNGVVQTMCEAARGNCFAVLSVRSCCQTKKDDVKLILMKK